jgi:hypothetical protein
MAVLAACITYFVSLMFGEVAFIVTASLAGCALGLIGRKDETPVRAMLPMYVILSGGLTYVAYLDSFFPSHAIFILPLAPLALWICSIGPLSRLRGFAATAVQFGVVILPTLVGLGLLWLGERSVAY